MSPSSRDGFVARPRNVTTYYAFQEMREALHSLVTHIPIIFPRLAGISPGLCLFETTCTSGARDNLDRIRQPIPTITRRYKQSISLEGTYVKYPSRE